MVDYLIVGLGLAGISACEVLEKNGKTFRVIANRSQTSSEVAAGLYNPVILKRFTLAWKAKEQLEMALPFYLKLERKLGVPLNHGIPVLRRFASVEEQNEWFHAADNCSLQPFLSTNIRINGNPNIDAPFGYGEVLSTGRIQTRLLLKTYRELLLKRGVLQKETFDFDQFKIEKDCVAYKSIKAKQVIFAEGYGLKKNPYFNYLPMNGTKGELLTIRAPDLHEENVIKSAVFLIPLGEELYRVGATYHWKDKTNMPTEEGKKELLHKLDTFLKCNYEVVDHLAGIRPTVADRRPLVGRHPKHQKLWVLNGFGSRGIMVAPFASHELYNYMEHNKPLLPEMDIFRFTKKYFMG